MEAYTSGAVRRVCNPSKKKKSGLSARTLGYWIDQGFVTPSAGRRHREGGRWFFYFDREAVLRVRLVKSLRDSGIFLEKIKIALDRLEGMKPAAKESTWLVTDGREIFATTNDPMTLQTLTGRGRNGQFVFSFVAIQQARAAVVRALEDERLVRLRRDSLTMIPWRPTG